MTNATAYLADINTAFDARVAYETAKNAENNSMISTLTNLRKSVSHERIAEVMLASNVSADFINKSERVNARFNVYAAEKVANVARFIAASAPLNHYTLAIVKTAFALEAAETALTHDDAQSACSLEVKCKDTKREKLIVKYAKHVAKNTAATQSSSSINALQMYGILVESKDASNTTVYTLDRSNTNCTKMLLALNLVSLVAEEPQSDAE